MYKDHFGRELHYMRVFLAGSDSALSNGFLNSIIGNKLALTGLAEFEQETGMPIYPIAGTGSTIFRGGLSPMMIDRYLEEFPGLKTATIQSAFRYDYPLDVVEPAIIKLREGLQKSKFEIINHDDQEMLLDIAKKAAAEYHETLDPLINDLQPVFDAFPKRRDRHQHVGIIGYSRDVDGYKMPRAITFTGALYSVGVPPEFLGTGRILNKLSEKELNTLLKYYPTSSMIMLTLRNTSVKMLWKHSKQRIQLGRQSTKILKQLKNYLISKPVLKHQSRKSMPN